MSNVASALKEEIVRLARKETRAETEGFKKASAQLRSEVYALKRRVASLEKVVSRLSKSAAAGKKSMTTPPDATRVRFRAKGLIALRRRLGLSAMDMGTLLGVSAQTIYNWEGEKSRPRQQQMVAFASLRGIGKRQATAKLAELAG
ncbi:MAG: helix-turn-helix domain-containing protein [Holophaga sp.]|jgi:DNA-binding transcriptional regulator YiaG